MKTNYRHSNSAENASPSPADDIQVTRWRVLFVLALVLMAGPKCLSFAGQGHVQSDTQQNPQPVEDIEKKSEADSRDSKVPLPGNFFGIRARVAGGLELNYEYLDVEDVGDGDSDSSSDCEEICSLA